uniref:Endonuclease domain-containing 1 protein-like n=1 Tax=Pelusios castaneus TaxID=367368 RepID=A0A8C8RSM3_9SAUR
MGPLALVGFASLWAGLGLAEVDSDFKNCKSFFYGGKKPEGFDTKKLNRVNICQKYDNRYFFATYYDKSSRIPIWSAYTMNIGNCQERKPSDWMVEPQLSGSKEINMKRERELTQDLTKSQATNADYERSGFDRGHLNPNCFQCGDGQTATYTLTNAVPMDPCFNRVHWKELELNLKKQLKDKCRDDWNPFLVTGAVPNAKYKIPQGNAGRVVVPSHIWTAVCCNHTDNNKKYSFAFLGENRPGSTLESMKVTDLNNRLKSLYDNQLIKIFQDDCNEDNPEGTKILDNITKELHSSFPNWDDKGPPGGKRPRCSVG